jgi:hypothetical protein
LKKQTEEDTRNWKGLLYSWINSESGYNTKSYLQI